MLMSTRYNVGDKVSVVDVDNYHFCQLVSIGDMAEVIHIFQHDYAIRLINGKFCGGVQIAKSNHIRLIGDHIEYSDKYPI